jgi:phage-related minor tail protein
MAGRNIKGITIEIGGDTTKLDKALKGVNNSLRTAQSNLRDVNRLLKLDPKNTELLKQKYENLQSAIKSTKEKL